MSAQKTALKPSFLFWLLSPPIIIAERMLAPYVGMSIDTWTAIIAGVLAGCSAGHWVGGLIAERSRDKSLGLITVWQVCPSSEFLGQITA